MIYKKKTHAIQQWKKRHSKWSAGVKGHFIKEAIQKTNRHTTKRSLLLLVRNKQVKTTIEIHVKPVQITYVQKTPNNMYWRRCGERAAPILLVGAPIMGSALDLSLFI